MTDDHNDRPDEELAAQLVERARAEGVDLVGPNGLLAGVTKRVLETGLQVEMSEHLGYDSTPWTAATAAIPATAPDRRPG